MTESQCFLLWGSAGCLVSFMCTLWTSQEWIGIKIPKLIWPKHLIEEYLMGLALSGLHLGKCSCLCVTEVVSE